MGRAVHCSATTSLPIDLVAGTERAGSCWSALAAAGAGTHSTLRRRLPAHPPRTPADAGGGPPRPPGRWDGRRLHDPAPRGGRGRPRHDPDLNREAVYNYTTPPPPAPRGGGVDGCGRRRRLPGGRHVRQSLIDGTPMAPPAPLTDCRAQFDNNDIYGGTYLDPTP